MDVSVTRVGLHLSGDSVEWIEFKPEIKEVDLITIQGEKTQEIWRGNIQGGEYNKIFIYVDDIKGILEASGETVEIKLPSNKLQISKPF